MIFEWQPLREPTVVTFCMKEVSHYVIFPNPGNEACNLKVVFKNGSEIMFNVRLETLASFKDEYKRINQ